MPNIESHVIPGAGWHLYGRRLAANVPMKSVITPRAGDRDPLNFRITMTVDIVDGRLACTALSAERLDDAAPGITGDDLRRIPVGHYVRYAATEVPFVVGKLIDKGHGTFEQVGVPEPPHDFAKGGMTDEALEQFADLYAVIQATGGKPSGVLLKDYGMPRATFSRWLDTARRRRILVEDHLRTSVPEDMELLSIEHHGVDRGER